MIRKLFVMAMCLLLPALCNAQSWNDCGWEYRFPFETRKPPGAPLVNYQLRLDLTAANVPSEFDWSAEGRDLRITADDGVTDLSFFIGLWDGDSMEATVWVLIPRLSGSVSTFYIYFRGPPGALSESSSGIFTDAGINFHTRRSTADPVDYDSAIAAYAAASQYTAGWGCAVIDSYVDQTNRSLFSPPNRRGDYGLRAETFFEVTAANAGTWEFRLGADFGRGAGLYVDDSPVGEKWNDDLDWDGSWSSTADIVEGAVDLAAGFHSLTILGFESCCDEGSSVQFRRPGGAWENLDVINMPLVSRQCARSEPVVTYLPVEVSSCPAIAVDRRTSTFADPINNTVEPYAIPGATILNTTTVSNTGAGPVDADSVVITELIPADVALFVNAFDVTTSGPVKFTDGSPVSGLSFSFGSLGDPTDDLSFSDDGGASFEYVPAPDATGVDVNVTHLRITPGGALQGSASGASPSAVFEFKTVVR